MSGELLYGIDEFVLAFVLLLFLYGSAELGFRHGRRSAPRIPHHAHSNIATIEGALLGLLGLLLGFAFAMAISRFDTRKQVVMEEANDIHTAYLRAQLLPDPFREECAELLKEYLDVRIAYYQAGVRSQDLRRAVERTAALQTQLWRQAVAAAREDSDEVRVGYFTESLNAVIDDHSKRIAAMENHVPETVLVLLFLVAILTSAATGHSCGLKKVRLTAAWVVLVLSVTATLLVIVDLDRPRRGLIRVSEQSLLDLKQQLNPLIPEAP